MNFEVVAPAGFELQEDFSEADNPRFYKFASFIVGQTIRARRPVYLHGLDNFPMSGPAVVDPVHRSIIDPFYMGSAMPRSMFAMAKQELWLKKYYLGLGHLLERLGAFPIDRSQPGHSSLEKAMEVLRIGKVVIAFSEGTSRYKGHDIRPGLDGVAWMALRAAKETESNCPIIPVGLNSLDLKRREPLHIVIEEPINTLGVKSSKQSRAEITIAVRDLKQKAYDRARGLTA